MAYFNVHPPKYEHSFSHFSGEIWISYKQLDLISILMSSIDTKFHDDSRIKSKGYL